MTQSKELKQELLPDKIYVRAVTDKTLSAVRPESPIAQAEWSGRLKRTEYVRADRLSEPVGVPDYVPSLIRAWAEKEAECMIERRVDTSFEIGFKTAWDLLKPSAAPTPAYQSWEDKKSMLEELAKIRKPTPAPTAVDLEEITDIAWEAFFNSDKPAPYNQMKDAITKLAATGRLKV